MIIDYRKCWTPTTRRRRRIDRWERSESSLCGFNCTWNKLSKYRSWRKKMFWNIWWIDFLWSKNLL